MEDNLTRINKFLSETGFCSRREADKLIEQGRVTINGSVPEMGTKISPNDEVRVDGKLVRENTQKQYILLSINQLELNVQQISTYEITLSITSIIQNVFSQLDD